MKANTLVALVVLDGSSASAYIVADSSILGSATELFDSSEPDGKEYVKKGIAAGVHTLTAALKHARKNNTTVAVPENVYVHVSSPWVHGELYEVTVSYPKPTKKSVTAIVDAIEDARAEHAVSLAKATKKLNLTCISARTVRLFENGYAVAQPVAGELVSLRATTLAHYIATDDKVACEAALKKALPGAKIHFESSVASLVTSVCQPSDSLADALVLSVSAHSTEAVLIINDNVEALATLPTGYSALLTEAETSLPVAGDALGFLSKYAQNALSERESHRVAQVFDRIVLKWAKDLGTVIRETGITSIPSTVLMVPPSPVAPLIHAMVGNSACIAELFSGTKPRIHIFPHTQLLTRTIPEVF